MATVYVPTFPNPTSGYIEILSLADGIMTDWTMEEAMTFMMAGGTSAKETLTFSSQVTGVQSDPSEGEGSPSCPMPA